MSNLGAFVAHNRILFRRSKADLSEWWHSRSPANKARNIFLSPTALAVGMMLLATYWNALMRSAATRPG